FLGRMFNIASFSISVMLRLIFMKTGDLIVIHTTPPLLAILVVGIAKLKREKVVYILMDIFPDGLIRLGKVSPKNPFIRLWKNFHRKALIGSHRVITIGRDMAHWVKGEVPNLPDHKLRVIPLWQDEKLISPGNFSNNPFVLKHNLSNYFVVQFSGNMGLWNDLETIGKVAAQGIDGVKFVFIGDGVRMRELVSAMGNSINDSMFFPFLDNQEYAHSVTACHCGLVTLRHEAVGMGVPSKIFGIMAAGIPVLAVAPKNSEIALIVNESECGIVVEPGDVQALVSAIMFLKDNPEKRKQMAINSRVAFENSYTIENGLKNYLSMFSEVLG
ncbi:MAG TPA: glycosyltransferase WbuB, partial [Bacteroidales bacterium]|nr:glycosyltransferase WbuB [Bacteroidales bacterium]